MSPKRKKIKKLHQTELHIEILPGWGHTAPVAPCPESKVHAKIRKNSAAKEPQKQLQMQIMVHPPKEGKVQLRSKRCKRSTSQAPLTLDFPRPTQKQENNEGPCPHPSAQVRLQQRRASAAQQCAANAASSSGADNEAYVPLDHYPVPDDDAIPQSKKKNKKKPRQRVRVRNKAFVDAVEESLDIIVTMSAEILIKRGERPTEESVFIMVRDVLLTRNLPARIVPAVALVSGRVNTEGIGFIKAAIAEKIQAAATADVEAAATANVEAAARANVEAAARANVEAAARANVEAAATANVEAAARANVEAAARANVGAAATANVGAAANKRPSVGAAARAAVSGSASVNNDSTGGAPGKPLAKPKPKPSPLAAKEDEPVLTLDIVMAKVEHVRHLAEPFFRELGAENSLDHIQGIQVQSFLAGLEQLAAPLNATETATGPDELMSLLNNFHNLSTMVNDLCHAAQPGKPKTADKCIGTSDFIVGVDASQMTDAGFARGELGLGLPPKTEEEEEARDYDDEETVSEGETDEAATAEAAASLGIPQISGAGMSIAEQKAAASNAKQVRFLASVRDSLSPNERKKLQMFLAQGEGSVNEKPRKKNLKRMVRDLDGLKELLNEAIDYYQKLKLAANEQAKTTDKNAKTIEVGQSVSDGTNGGPPAEQQAEEPLMEEKPNAEQRPGLVGTVPNGPRMMDNSAKKEAAAVKDNFEIPLMHDTNKDGKFKLWYENGEQVTGKYFPMILGGAFNE